MMLCSQQEEYLNLRTKDWKQDCLTILPKDTLGYMLPTMRNSSRLELLVPKEKTVFSEDKEKFPLNYNLWQLPGHHGPVGQKSDHGRSLAV